MQIDEILALGELDQFRSITQVSIDNDKSRSDSLTVTLNNSRLFNLPAGPVGSGSCSCSIGYWLVRKVQLN